MCLKLRDSLPVITLIPVPRQQLSLTGPILSNLPLVKAINANSALPPTPHLLKIHITYGSHIQEGKRMNATAHMKMHVTFTPQITQKYVCSGAEETIIKLN